MVNIILAFIAKKILISLKIGNVVKLIEIFDFLCKRNWLIFKL